jgi:hypothetical protein
MKIIDPIDFLEKPDDHYKLAADVLRRQDLATLRRVVTTDGGLGYVAAAPTPSLMRLEATGLVNRDGAIWTPTTLGKESVRVSASCRDGSEGLRHPKAWWRTRWEDRKNPPPADGDLVSAIVEFELRLATAKRDPLDEALSAAIDALADEMNAVPSDELRVAIIARAPGRLERAVGAVDRFVRWHVGSLVIGVAVLLAGIEWAINERGGRR